MLHYCGCYIGQGKYAPRTSSLAALNARKPMESDRISCLILICPFLFIRKAGRMAKMDIFMIIARLVYLYFFHKHGVLYRRATSKPDAHPR